MYRKTFIEISTIQRLAACASLLLASLVYEVPAAAAQNRPNIANDAVTTEKKNGAEKDKDAGKQADDKRVGGSGGNRRRQRSTPPAVPLEVVFTTDLPESDIFLNSPGGRPQKLGKTDAEGKLAVKLPRGTHSVTVSHIGHRTERSEIEVRPGNTNFSFSVALPEPKADTVAAKAEPTPTPAEDPAEKEAAAAAAAEETAKRFLDAQKTESVTANDWQLFATHTNAALEKDPGNALLKAQSLFAQGQLDYLRGDYPSALVAFNKAVLAAPELISAHYGLGNAYLATNQPAQAIKAYQRAAELNPDLVLAYKGIGDAYTKQGKNKEANVYYQRAKRFGPLPSSSNMDTALLSMKRKRWAEALKELLEISKTQPSADVYIYIGDSYDGMKQPLSASEAYQKASELDPKSALAAYRYGEKMFELREYPKAMEALERALALDQTGITINRKRAREMADKAAEQLRKLK
ncbi:MAG TPA: tetratricopeptide repeat protein [Pyrinomonadaceae bacterium]|nr:tetratricopeptide repeat protein [Pyrinomonadaceae bacterium]